MESVLTNDIQPTPAFNAMFSIESSVRSALDIPRTHSAYLACYEEQSASSAELGALVPAPEVPLYSWEEETAGGADEEAYYVQLVDIGDFILGSVNILEKGMVWLIMRALQRYAISMVTYLKQSEDSPDKVGPGNEVSCREPRHLMQQVNDEIKTSRFWISYEDG